MEYVEKYPVGAKVQVTVEVEVTRCGYTYLDVDYTNIGGRVSHIEIPFRDVVTEPNI